MIDASGSIPSGLLDGTLSDFGDYDQCLALQSSIDPSIRGKHCMIKAKLLKSAAKTLDIEDSFLMKNDFSINIGLCQPSICSAQEIKEILLNGN